MNCHWVRDELKGFIDGEIELFDRWNVEQHLETCATCREEEIAMRNLIEKLSTADEFPAPDGLRERVMSKLDNVGTSAPSSR